MKIAVISPNQSHLEEVGRVLEAKGHRRVSFRRRQEPDARHRRAGAARPDAGRRHVLRHGRTGAGRIRHHPPSGDGGDPAVLDAHARIPDQLDARRRARGAALASDAAGARSGGGPRRRQAGGRRPAKPAKILAFMPCKGGAGATFLATNLGWQLARDEIGPADRPEPAVRRRALVRARRQAAFDAGRCGQEHQPAGRVAARRQHRQGGSELQHPGGARKTRPMRWRSSRSTSTRSSASR